MKIEFLGDYSKAVGLARIRELSQNSKKTLIIVPTDELRQALTTELGIENARVVQEFEGILAFSKKIFPTTIERELVALRVLRSEEGKYAGYNIFPKRQLGLPESRTLVALFDELFLLNLTCNQIAETLKANFSPDAQRWISLSILQDEYEIQLRNEGYAVAAGNHGLQYSLIILFGILNPSLRLKNLISETTTETVSLVFDSQKKQDAFGAFGELIAWDVTLPFIKPEFVNSGRDYEKLVTPILQNSLTDLIAFDELEARIVSQRLSERGIKVRERESNNFPHLKVLVDAISLAARTQRVVDLFSVVRILAVQKFLSSKLSSIPEMGILKALDEYQSDKLQLRWTERDFPYGKNHSIVRETIQILKETFIFPFLTGKNIADVATVISGWIRLLYPEAVSELESVEQLFQIKITDSVPPDESAKLIIRKLLNSNSLKLTSGDCRIYQSLEQAYYQATGDLVVLGATKERLPQLKSRSIFLNSGVLKILGIGDVQCILEKYYFDKLSSRIKLAVVPKMQLNGDPTSVSPLLFPQDAKDIAKEVLRFFDETATSVTKEKTQIEIVKLRSNNNLDSIRNSNGEIQLSVTAFDYFWTAPFQFYLERILKAHSLSDRSKELNAMQFGDLAHLVLKSIVSLKPTAEYAEIKSLFEVELKKLTSELYGSNLSAAIEVQFTHLRDRLESYAHYQVQFLKEGWETVIIEQSSDPLFLSTTKEPIKLTARVDRVDYNRELNTYRVWDYKTGDSLKGIFAKDGSILSLQLPLYAFFLSRGLFGPIEPNADFEIGYIALSSAVSEPKAEKIYPSKLEETFQLANSVAEDLVQCKFQMGPKEKVSAKSDLSIFCGYSALDFSEEAESVYDA
jgi:RecB family exonuclease